MVNPLTPFNIPFTTTLSPFTPIHSTADRGICLPTTPQPLFTLPSHPIHLHTHSHTHSPTSTPIYTPFIPYSHPIRPHTTPDPGICLPTVTLWLLFVPYPYLLPPHPHLNPYLHSLHTQFTHIPTPPSQPLFTLPSHPIHPHPTPSQTVAYACPL